MARSFRVLAGVAAAIATAFGSESPAPEGRRVIFRVFAAEPFQSISYLPAPDRPPAELRFFPTALSPAYAYEGPAALLLRDSKGDDFAKVQIPDSGDSFIIFVSRPGTSDAGSGGFLLDDSPARWPPGSLVIANLSGLQFSGIIRGRAVPVLRGIAPPVAIGRSAEIVLRVVVRGRFVQVHAEPLTFNPNERALLLLLPPVRNGSIEPQSRMILD